MLGVFLCGADLVIADVFLPCGRVAASPVLRRINNAETNTVRNLQEKLEQERLERLEQERLQQERLERERLERDRLERGRLERRG
jgi:hypothetical protein